MKRYSIWINKKAKEEINTIYQYICREFQAPETAKKQKKRIIEAIKKLDRMPERIKRMESEPEHSLGIRRLLVDHYSVFFLIEGDHVIVIKVLYSASNIEEKLRV